MTVTSGAPPFPGVPCLPPGHHRPVHLGGDDRPGPVFAFADTTMGLLALAHLVALPLLGHRRSMPAANSMAAQYAQERIAEGLGRWSQGATRLAPTSMP